MRPATSSAEAGLAVSTVVALKVAGLGGLESEEYVGGTLTCAFGPCEGPLGPSAQRLSELSFSAGEIILAARARRGCGLEPDLLLVKHVLADSLRYLCLVDLSLVGVLAILLEPDVGAALGVCAGSSVRLGLARRECCCGVVEWFLLAVNARLLAVGDPLVEIRDGLFLVEVALQVSLLAVGCFAHVVTPLGFSIAVRAAGRPMWYPWT